MAQIAKVESQVDIKSSAEKFYQAFQYQQNLWPNMCPNFVKDLQLIKGDWASVGSIRKWIIAPTGDSSATECCVARVEAADDKKKSVTTNMIDGELKKLYNSYIFTVQAIDNGDGSGSIVKTTLEYEKKNEDVPEPSKYFEFAALLYKSMDSYLVDDA